MGYPSYADVKRAFAVEDGIQEFSCIGHKRNTACKNPLIDQRKGNAKMLLQKDIFDLEELERLNVVVFLLCAAYQITNTQRQNVKAKWQSENLGIELWRKGLRSPFSLRLPRSKNTPCRSCTQKKLPKLRSSTRSSRRCRHQEPPSSPCEDHRRRHHHIPSLRVPGTVDGPGNEPQQDISELESVVTLAQTPNQESAGTPPSRRKVFGEPIHQVSDTQRFHRGRHWNYSPSTLRLQVLRKLFEPVRGDKGVVYVCPVVDILRKLCEPVPGDTGVVYVVPVVGTQFVKIGKTTLDRKSVV